VLEISVVDGHLVGEKREPTEPETKWRGAAKGIVRAETTDGYLAEVRG
jgi:hypothetical protein